MSDDRQEGEPFRTQAAGLPLLAGRPNGRRPRVVLPVRRSLVALLILLALVCLTVGALERGDLAVESRMDARGSSFAISMKTGVRWFVAGAVLACVALAGEIRRRRLASCA